MNVNVETVAPAGELQAQLEAARSGSVVALLSHLALLRFQGEDAENFLQGQLTCDVAGIGESAAYGSYCSPKGRMLASFLLWRGEDGFFMALPGDVAAGIQQRLAKFVLRSKVRIEEATPQVALLGCAGPEAAAALRGLFGKLSDRPLQVTRRSRDDVLLRLDESRFLIALPAAEADSRIGQFATGIRRVAPLAWQWLDVRRGIPWITAATQDRFVPQMANFELIGGVSFTKGCYTGQEVVARVQHLGQVKRRMFLANVGAPAAPGDELYAEDLGDQASGVVVNAAPSPDGGCDLLAVVQAAAPGQSSVHLKSPDGPPLRFLPPPYPVA